MSPLHMNKLWRQLWLHRPPGRWAGLCRRQARYITQHTPVRVRFAPSPTGQLHVGGLRTALYNFLFAKSQGGSFILRIEDTDQTRLVPGATSKIIEALSWAGIEIDEGPQVGGKYGPYFQSERLPLYHEHSDILLQSGAGYRCFCTSRRLDLLKKEAAKRGETPKYDNKCRHLTQEQIEQKLAANEPYVVRLKLEHCEEPWHDLVYGNIYNDVAAVEGDPVLMKTDGYPTYHFACVVDDHLMKISHVLRGLEWQVSTAKHIQLYKALGWTPPKFAHLPLLLNKDGKKLSKRQNDVHVEAYKEKGYLPEAVLSLLTSMGSGFRIKDPAKCKTMNERIAMFDLEKMNTNSSRVDFDKLSDFNKYHLGIKLKNPQERQKVMQNVRTMLTDYRSNRINQENAAKKVYSEEYLLRALDWSKDHLNILSDLLQPYFDFLWCSPSHAKLQTLNQTPKVLRRQLSDTREVLEGLPEAEFTREKLARALKDLSTAKKWKFGPYMKTLRVSLSGLTEGPSVAEMMWVVGRDTTLKRLQTAQDSLHSKQQHQASQTS